MPRDTNTWCTTSSLLPWCTTWLWMRRIKESTSYHSSYIPYIPGITILRQDWSSKHTHGNNQEPTLIQDNTSIQQPPPLPLVLGVAKCRVYPKFHWQNYASFKRRVPVSAQLSQVYHDKHALESWEPIALLERRGERRRSESIGAHTVHTRIVLPRVSRRV